MRPLAPRWGQKLGLGLGKGSGFSRERACVGRNLGYTQVPLAAVVQTVQSFQAGISPSYGTIL